MVLAYIRRKVKYERDHEKEYMVKAALLIKFCQHTNWPAFATAVDTDVINICITGENPFPAKAMAVFAAANSDKRQYNILKGDAYKKRFCHIAFIGYCKPKKLERILDELRTVPTLTVSDIEGFAGMGGNIELVIEAKSDKDQKVKLVLNERAALEKGLSFDRQMKKPNVSTVIHKSN